jgi:hypothetical protein
VRAKEHATITRSASSIAPGFKYHSATKPFSAHHQFQLQTARWLCNNRYRFSLEYFSIEMDEETQHL